MDEGEALNNGQLSLLRFDDFQDKVLIGSGFYSNVYKVKSVKGETLALKLNLKEENRANCIREIQILRQLSHRNILQFKEVCISDSGLHPLTEFVEGGTLAEFIALEAKIKWSVKQFISLEVSIGMQYLHANNIFHRDLASKNIFLERGEQGSIKRAVVGDFGLAVEIPSNKGAVALSVVGSPYWMAPECMKIKGDVSYDHKVDVFSYGIVLCELCAQVDADPDYLPRTNDFGVDWNLFTPMLNKFKCPSKMASLIKLSTEVDPDMRPEFSVIVQMLQSQQTAVSSHINQGASEISSPSSSDPDTSPEVFEEDSSPSLYPPRERLNPFRSNSISLPFKEGGIKLLDSPDERDLFANMDPQLSKAVESAGFSWIKTDDRAAKSGKSRVRIARSSSDASSLHTFGYQTVPASCKLAKQFSAQTYISGSEDAHSDSKAVDVSVAHQSSQGSLHRETYLQTLATVRKGSSKTNASKLKSSWIDSSRLKKNRSLHNLYEDEKPSTDSAIGLSSWANLSDALNLSFLSSQLDLRATLSDGDRMFSPDDALKKRSEHDIELSQSIEHLEPAQNTADSKIADSTKIASIICEQVDKLFDFLALESETNSDEFESPAANELQLSGVECCNESGRFDENTRDMLKEHDENGCDGKKHSAWFPIHPLFDPVKKDALAYAETKKVDEYRSVRGIADVNFDVPVDTQPMSSKTSQQPGSFNSDTVLITSEPWRESKLNNGCPCNCRIC